MDASLVVAVPLVHNDHTTSESDDSVFLFEDNVHESEIGHFINEYYKDGTRIDYMSSKNNLVITAHENGYKNVKTENFCFLCINKLLLQVLLKELEEFAFKGIPDVRGCKVQDAQILEEIVSTKICSSVSKLFSISDLTVDLLLSYLYLQSDKEHDIRLSEQRQKQQELIEQLKSQLEDLETYAYEVILC